MKSNRTLKLKYLKYQIFKLPCNELLISDYKTGFGGQYGVQNDRQDKSAVGWDHQEKLQQHESQKGK